MTTAEIARLRGLGRQLGEYVKRHAASQPTQRALQGVMADLAAGMPDLQAALRDLVCRQSFLALLHHAGSRGGLIQRDALIQEISHVYHPDVLVQVEEVLNGFLDASGGIASSLLKARLHMSDGLRTLDDGSESFERPSNCDGSMDSTGEGGHSQYLSTEYSRELDSITSSILMLAGVPYKKAPPSESVVLNTESKTDF